MGQKTIEFPESVFATAESLGDLEDWLAAKDPGFLDEMRRIRSGEDLAGQGRDLSEILERWPIGS